MKKDFQHLNEDELLIQTHLAAKTEKASTVVLLDYLCEVDSRKSYTTKAYSSLFEYIVKELGYSESQASDRVNTVRLMRSVPEVKDHLQSGKLNLTTASQIQRFIQAEKKVSSPPTPESKAALIQECLLQSKRQVEKILFSRASEPVRIAMKEHIIRVDQNRVELKLTLESKTEEKLKRARELVRAETLAQLFDKALDALIEHEEKRLGKTKFEEPHPTRPATQLNYSTPSKTRYIPVHFRRAIFERSQGQCEYKDSISERRCNSKAHLEIDHIQPLALNGKTELNNLRHLCRNHNLRCAMEYGLGFQFQIKE